MQSLEQLEFTPAFVFRVWMEGGWVMVPLALLTLYIYYQGTSLYFHLGNTLVRTTPIAVWEKWVRDPRRGIGHIGDVIRYVMAGGADRREIMSRLEEIRHRIVPSIDRRVLVLGVLVTVSPLMGLLGTVIGMLTTFRGMATSAGKTVDLVAEGIRVALITTQTGLIIAIPGYILIYLILRRRTSYNVFLSQLENLVIQNAAYARK